MWRKDGRGRNESCEWLLSGSCVFLICCIWFFRTKIDFGNNIEQFIRIVLVLGIDFVFLCRVSSSGLEYLLVIYTLASPDTSFRS